jgi:hypothetical protein
MENSKQPLPGFTRVCQTLRVTPGDFKSRLELGRDCWFVALISGCGGFRVWSMKSKQLANVLIKIIGLYVCLCAIPGLVSGIAPVLALALGSPKWDDYMFTVLADAIGAIIQLMVGIFLVIKSRKLAEFWFKNEDE